MTTRCASRPLPTVRPRPTSWCARGWRRDCCGPCFMTLSNGGRKNRAATARTSGCGAAACSSGSATSAISMRSDGPALRDRIIEQLSRHPPGRRGFGGSADPEEAAAFRRVLGSDRLLNPGLTLPSTALRPAAVLVPLIDHAEGMSVLLTQRAPHLTAHAGQISFPGGRMEKEDADAV